MQCQQQTQHESKHGFAVILIVLEFGIKNSLSFSSLGSFVVGARSTTGPAQKQPQFFCGIYKMLRARTLSLLRWVLSCRFIVGDKPSMRINTALP